MVHPELERLRAAVAAFEEASACGLGTPTAGGLGRVGRIVALLENATVGPEWTAGTIRSPTKRLGRNADDVNAVGRRPGR